jgi:hypothetical protein
MLVDRRLLPTDRYCISGRVTVFDRVSFWLLSRGAKKTVRGKPRGVNSVFLVQLRKMAGADLWIDPNRETLHRCLSTPRTGREFREWESWPRNAGWQIVHRDAQEMQKAVVVTRGQSWPFLFCVWLQSSCV